MDMTPVSSTLLEERVAMYLQAIEHATAANDMARRQALEKDIQILMDLMERVSVGQAVPINAVPPPLQVHSHAGESLANPLGELSSRLADYHKALYYADIEMVGESRTKQIQTLQRGLQVIQKLQEKAQAGYPIRAEEIPPPIPIPTEEEFVVDPKSVISERIALYFQALELAEEDNKQTRIEPLRNGIQKLEYLLKRAETNIPIYKKDLPCSPALGPKFRQQTEQYRKTVELLTKMIGLSARAAKLAGDRGDKVKDKQLQHNAKMLSQALQSYEAGKPLDMSSCPYSLADIQRLADEAGVPASQHIQDAETVRLRCNQYKLEALKAKRSGDTDLALQHMRVVKGLQSLLHTVEKGESIDMTQVPPPPSEQTPTTEEQARILTQAPTDSDHLEERVAANSGVDGMSLAEELSAYLLENGPSSESSGHFLRDGSSSDSSPARAVPAHASPSRPQTSSTGQRHHPGQNPTQTSAPSMAPSRPQTSFTGQRHHPRQNPTQTSVPNMSASSGLNPLYMLTQNTPGVSRTSALVSGGQGEPRAHPSVPAPLPAPSRRLKPGTSWTDSCPPIPARVPMPSLNGFLENEDDMVWENVVWDPAGTNRENGKRGENMGGFSMKMGRSVTSESNGIPLSRSETSCIEILKYEGMQLDKEGSHEAKAAAERLRRLMEEAKRRLRGGGYEAWLAYLGQVEGDVSSINCHMKLAREGGQQEQLASLVIKKELAERELAVMRKRLPELQTYQTTKE